MFPKIVGPINSYGLMIMIGFLLATYIALRRLRSLPWRVDPDDPGVSKGVGDEAVRRKLLEASTIERLRDEADRAGERFRASALVERKSITPEQLDELARAVHSRRNADFVLDLAIVSMIFGLLGGKLTYIVQNWGTYAESMKLFDVSDGVHPLGAFLGFLPFAVFWYATRKKKLDLGRSKKTWALVLLTTLAFALIGVRGAYLWKHSDAYPAYTWRVLTTWQSGFVLYGGMLLGVVAGIVFTRLRRMPVLLVGDIAAPSLMLGVAFGRIGCFLNGCCYGTVCDSFWCISFPEGSLAYANHMERGLLSGKETGWSLPVHPTQLYEAAATVLLFFVMSRLLRKASYDGLVLLGTLMAYAAWRFFAEFLRGDPGRETLGAGDLTFSQTVSVAVFAAAAIGILVILRKKPRFFAGGS